MTEQGQRGKVAEKMAQAALDQMNSDFQCFAYERLPDPRAAGGRLAAALCDYLIWYKGKSIPLEVKSIKHAYLLPKKNLSQHAKLKKVALAGAWPHVLVYHSELKKWRIMPIDFFTFNVPSWNLSEFPLFDSVHAAFLSLEIFS